MDIKALSERIGLEIDEYRELLELFVESGGSDLEALESAVSRGSPEQVHAASHSLKGSAGSLGLETLHLIAKDIDDAVRRGTLEGVAERAARLRREYDLLAAQISRLVTKP